MSNYTPPNNATPASGFGFQSVAWTFDAQNSVTAVETTGGGVYATTMKDLSPQTYVLDPSNGKALWAHRGVVPVEASNDGSLLIVDGGNSLQALNTGSAHGTVQFSFDTTAGNLVFTDDGQLVYGAGNSRAVCMNAKNGSLYWCVRGDFCFVVVVVVVVV